MAKLVEIAARDVQYWPGYKYIAQRADGLLFCTGGGDGAHRIGYSKIADDRSTAVVTRAQWEVERERIALNNDIRATVVSDLEGLREIGLATDDDVKEAKRLAMNQQATAEAREIARTGALTAEEQELSDIACGKRSKEDQALWDKVAISSITSILDIEYGRGCEYKELASECFDFADAFMAERAKRLKGV